MHFAKVPKSGVSFPLKRALMRVQMTQYDISCIGTDTEMVAMAKKKFINRDGRFLIGDEIINVNGARYVFFKRKVKYL